MSPNPVLGILIPFPLPETQQSLKSSKAAHCVQHFSIVEELS